ncbi:class I SAM-dependent methyltransferase [Arthrobacter zhangbolii]|uniref:Class I SAM-dependent methyltransferase n=1 Tax=Arthrobacter zhangbolii TaxID=2886936 RepID=A0A9X1S9W7_9MICC|nr:class I SAM-dependent methyltransferase [Arthrobacter zhangbolii]MCC3273583.1 class I SAM-dependent methyltransferase [Arthrobacter zhangbolii]UON92393.1 class I SAM-dependent methyltransferase [Arthrobacter zhangbolii]
MRKETLWEAKKKQNPGHSAWYIQRFKQMREQGVDLHGEARLIDAMVPRGARILDAGAGPGRVGGELARRGHAVVGVDVDPELIDAARNDHPQATWLVGDLTELDLPAEGIREPFDLIVCAGNVMTFLAPGTAREVLARMRAHLAPEGRVVIGFGAGRGYDFGQFFADAEAAGLGVDLKLSTWDLRPLTPDAGFLVAVLSAAPGGGE